jgi:hypothetical protein
MGNNFYALFEAGTSDWTALSFNTRFSTLDRVLTIYKDIFIGCDGVLSYAPSAEVLEWTGDIIIYYVNSEGVLLKNIIVWSSADQDFAIADNKYIYVDLGLADAELTIAEAALTADSASTSILYNRLVLGWKDANGKFYPSKALSQVFLQQLI